WPFEPRLQKKLARRAKALLRLDDEESDKADRTDWWTFLRGVGFSDRDLLRRDLMDSTDFGESIRHVGSVSAASEYYGPHSDPFDEMDSRIVGGNIRLVNALAKAIDTSAIHTGLEVTHVRQDGQRVYCGVIDVRARALEPPRRGGPRPERWFDA